MTKKLIASTLGVVSLLTGFGCSAALATSSKSIPRSANRSMMAARCAGSAHCWRNSTAFRHSVLTFSPV